MIYPTNDNVFVERCEAAKMDGLIHIPDKSQRAPSEGIVYSIGPMCQLHPETGQYLLQPGQRIMWASYAGEHMEHGDLTLVQIPESSVLAIFEES